jgi:hypothetical protein
MTECPLARLARYAVLAPSDPEVLALINEAMRRGCLASDVDAGTNPATLLEALLTAMRSAWASDMSTPHTDALRAPAGDSGLPAQPHSNKASPARAGLDHSAVEKVSRALQKAGAAGLTRTAIRDLFGRNVPAHHIEVALVFLNANGIAEREIVSATGGRPREVWRVANAPGGNDIRG